MYFVVDADAKSLHEFVLENLPTEHVANLRRRDQADAFLANECKNNSGWGACGVLFTDKYDTSAALKALSFRYRDRVRRAYGGRCRELGVGGGGWGRGAVARVV